MAVTARMATPSRTVGVAGADRTYRKQGKTIPCFRFLSETLAQVNQSGLIAEHRYKISC